MYPRLSDMINDLLGTNLHFPVQTFGFFVALGFIFSYWIIKKELQRKEKLGHYKLRLESIQTDGPFSIFEVIFPAVLWGIVGYKIGYAFVDYKDFYEHTQDIILSGKGWWLSGILCALAYGIPRFLVWKKKSTTQTVIENKWVGPSWYMNLVLVIAFFTGILGSKIATWVEDMDQFWKDPMGAIFSFDGLAFYGGLILAAICIIWYLKSKGFAVLAFVDGFAPGLILGYTIGRMGCQFSGDGDWGDPNPYVKPGFLPQWMWASDYPHNVAREGIHIDGCQGPFCYKLEQPAWPTPVYEIILGFMILGFLLWIRKRLPYAGQLTGVYLLAIATERLFIEIIRINQQYKVFGIPIPISQAQGISILLIILGAYILIRQTRKKPPYPKKDEEIPLPAE